MRQRDEDDDDEKRYLEPVLVCPEELLDRDVFELDRDGFEGFPSETTELNPSLLPEGKVLEFTYDMRSPTRVYLKVLKVQDGTFPKSFNYTEAGADAAQDQRDLKAVPAYNLPKEQQLDTFYPWFSKAFWGDLCL